MTQNAHGQVASSAHRSDQRRTMIGWTLLAFWILLFAVPTAVILLLTVWSGAGLGAQAKANAAAAAAPVPAPPPAPPPPPPAAPNPGGSSPVPNGP
jgi:uncharacterized BrkB/YihY/UPF0761 family membrane protein